MFEWRQWGLLLYSGAGNPPQYAWTVVNHRWNNEKATALPRRTPPAWFRCSDRIAVVNEERGIEYAAKPADTQYRCCRL